MPIALYIGLPGHGKSHGVVENVILPALKAGRRVVTNIPLKFGRISDDFPDAKVQPFQMEEGEDLAFWSIDNFPPGSVFVIDEAQRYWPSGLKANQLPKDCFTFFSQHRHAVGDNGFTNEIVLISQDSNQIAAPIRNLVEETYRARKLTQVGSTKRYRVDVFAGPAKLADRSKPLRQLTGTYKEKVYQYYKSHTLNKTDFAAGMEEKIDKRANVLKSWPVRIGLPVAACLFLVGAYTAFSYFSRDVTPSPETQSPTDIPGRPLDPTRPYSPATKPRPVPPETQRQASYELQSDWLPISETWRIVGDVNGVFILWSQRGTRQVHSRRCSSFESTGEPFCVINGHLVTWFSAQIPYEPETETTRNYIPASLDSPD